ncbi:MAG: NYN domain-containing protein, partial [Proteobacteria bacterium]|nr:NYN domain-containing protein [Pseudomonadota bacterium]
MIFYPNERIALFVDGSNLFAAARTLGFDIDYRALLDEFSTKGTLVRALYYTAILEDQDFSPLR